MSGPAGVRRAAPHWWALLAILGVSTAVRLAGAYGVPLLDDEAYYWVWSRHLLAAYPDHPPMVAVVVAMGTRLLGDSVVGVRLIPVLLGTLSTLAIYAMARSLFSPTAGLRAATLYQVLPASFASGLMAAPESPLAFFWLLAMLSAWAATRGARWAWPAAGLAVGLAVQSKLAGGVLAISLAGFVLTTRAQWRHLGTPWPYAAAIAGALVLTPLVRWNLQHGWATVRHIAGMAPWMEPVHPAVNVAALVGSQFVFYAPLGFGLLVAALVDLVRHARGDERHRFLLWCAAPTLAAVALASAGALAKPHHTGPAYLAAIVAAAGAWERWRARGLQRAAVLSSAALTALALVLAAVPTPLSRGFHLEARVWPAVARAVERLLPELGSPGEVFILAEAYQAASQLAFALRDRGAVVVDAKGFALWNPASAWVGRAGIYVDHTGGEPLVRLVRAFERVGAPQVVPVGPGWAAVLYPGFGFRGFR